MKEGIGEKEQLREELKTILNAGILVKRFTGDDLPKDVIQDTVYTHSLRLSSLTYYFPIPGYLQREVVTTVLIHDLPEIFCVISNGNNADVTAPEKEKNPGLAKETAESEMHAAHLIFNQYELNLYKQFELATDFLKGKTDEIPTKVAMFAALLDSIDANLTLHQALSQWSLTDEYDPSLVNPHRSLTFAFRQYELFKEAIQMHPSREVQTIGGQMMRGQVEAIMSYWRTPLTKGVNIPKQLLNLISI